MFRLALQSLPARRHAVAGAFVALMAAVALVTACGMLVETGVRTLPPVERYAAAPVVVAARQTVPVRLGGPSDVEWVHLPEQARIPAALADRLASVEGVQAVIADRSIPATLTTSDGRTLRGANGQAVVGHGWSSTSLTPYRIVAGRAPRTDDEVVLDADLAARQNVGLGARVQITSTDGTSGFTVVGLARPPEANAWQGVVFVSDGLAASLAADPAYVDAIGLLLEGDADTQDVAQRVRRAVAEGIEVFIGDDRGRAESVVSTHRNEELIELGGAFGGFAALLAILVVAATLELSVLQRGREVALLRAVGAKPGQIRSLLVGEAVVLSVVAGVPGSALGVLIGSLLFYRLREWGIGAATADLFVGPVPFLIAIAAGLVTAAMAALVAGRRAARIRPMAVFLEAAVEPRRTRPGRLMLGVAFLIGGVLLSGLALSSQGDVAMEASFGSMMVLMIAGGLLGPILARVAAAVWRPVIATLSRTSGFLAMANLRAKTRRLSSVCTPITIGIAFSLVVIGTVTVQAEEADRQSRDRVVAERVLTAPGGLPHPLLDDVLTVPGVDGTTSVLPTQVGTLRRALDGMIFEYLPAVGISPEGIERTLDLDVQEGSFADFPDDGVAVSVDRARSLGIGLGDEVQMWLGDGVRKTTRLVATYESSLGFGEFVLSRDAVAAHVSVPMDELLLISYSAEAHRSALDSKIRALAGDIPGLSVLGGGTMWANDDAQSDDGANYLLIAVLLVFLALAAANSLFMAIGERSKELALLRFLGATRPQVIRMIRLEAIVVIGFAMLLGVLIAALALVPFSLAVAATPIPYLPWQMVVGVLGSATVLSFVASELPARAITRLDPTKVVGATA